MNNPDDIANDDLSGNIGLKEKPMYQAFDPYLNASTWATNHHLDDERFYKALATVVHDPAFDADAMGQHFRTVKSVNPNNAQQAQYNGVIEQRITQAHAIREYLEVTGDLSA